MMQPLEKSHRSTLENTVKEARDAAEDAARAALEQLGVGEAAPFEHLTEEERELRRKLRVHGRQLGDALNGGKVQTMDRLIEEVAYEHWHRMLFARFLAENDLLMYPDPDEPVAVTLEECEDLAEDEGAVNGWELAARYAARMLPQIFRPDSSVFQLTLPPEHQQKLERLLADLPVDIFTASDSLGWVYQFWQSKRKANIDKAIKSGLKVNARELGPKTQLFTEPYMVSFLLDNALGACWASKRLTENDLKKVTSEEELRRKAAIPGVALEYLRFVKQDDESWIPASGTFEDWPENLSELKVLDPCCGSGHFLVAVFLMLVPMRMALEGLSAREAADRVLSENIHGLELDRRCVELAAFALAITAWRYPGAEGYRSLPELHIACSGLPVGKTRTQWEKIANGNVKLKVAMAALYEEFKQAEVLGSLINPSRKEIARLHDWNELSVSLKKALDQNRTDEEREAGIMAQGLVEAAGILVGKYHWVVTNVPYLVRGKQGQELKHFCETYYPNSKNELATVFLDRCLELSTNSLAVTSKHELTLKGGDENSASYNGVVSVVMPQNWLFQTTYKNYRKILLKSKTWHIIARLGPGAFETISGEVVKAILINLSREYKETDSNIIHCIDVADAKNIIEKSTNLKNIDFQSIEQSKQLLNPDSRIVFENLSNKPLLADVAEYGKGSTTGDGRRFLLFYWEFPALLSSHVYWLNSPNNSSPWSGRQYICKVLLTNDELKLQGRIPKS